MNTGQARAIGVERVKFEGKCREHQKLLPQAWKFGAYVPADQTGNILFLSGMLATLSNTVTAASIMGKDLDVNAGPQAATKAALNALALTRKQLGSLNRQSRVAR